ncbi:MULTISPECIES: branched-chain amino acid ABC transporter permease [Streptomyces]|uniref:branched-chain amino acid ABC transporter permease n=1 Tax=Streptomyces TaxID=1883 RepID=UPI000C59E74E|nr:MULTISPECIES: branched-chain amino acid ABC transporter permease [Streptomyces]PIB02734.1 hypothetical protein B1C81_37905 [Streptomyces sp. HG99]
MTSTPTAPSVTSASAAEPKAAAVGRSAATWLGRLPRGAVPVVFFGALLAAPWTVGAPWIVNLLIFTMMYAAMASAWNLVGGFAGYPSLGHAAFFGVGAYTQAIWFNQHPPVSGWEPFLALPLVAVVTAALGLPVAWVAMRTRTTTFAIVTITLLFLAQTIAYNAKGLTGGAQGVGIAPAPFSAAYYAFPFYYVLVAVLAFAVAVTWYVRRSRLGLVLLTVRDDEDKARGVGAPTTVAKLAAFSLSVGITGAVGAVWAYYVSFVYPAFAVDPLVTIGMVLMVFLGGRGTLWGPVLGAFLVVPFQQYLAYRLGANSLHLVGYAALFLTVMLVLPRGILPSVADRLRLGGRVNKR